VAAHLADPQSSPAPPDGAGTASTTFAFPPGAGRSVERTVTDSDASGAKPRSPSSAAGRTVVARSIHCNNALLAAGSAEASCTRRECQRVVGRFLRAGVTTVGAG